MAVNLIRFEIVLPIADSGTPTANAINTFIDNMLTLCQLVMYSAYIYPQGGNHTNLSSQNLLYGLITNVQQATALGFLNTLNASLGFNVECIVNTVTSEP